jgi:transmembrane sensor
MSMDKDQLDPLQREAHDWVARFARGDATAADLEAMKTWHAQSPAHAAAYAKARQLWRSLGPVAHSSVQTDRSFAPSRRPAGRRAFLTGALAASAAAGVGYVLIRPPAGLWPSLEQLTADYRTGTGEQRQVTIADQISLDLNTQTSLAIRPAAHGRDHLELIAGEAMISIDDAARPVTVAAAGGRSIAGQARFNLRYDEASSCIVTCLEGSLQVEHGDVTRSLMAGEQVVYGGRSIGPVTAIDPEAVTAWRRGLLIFEFTPVAQAIEEVNRYRPGRIVLLNETIGRRVFNARFRIADADKVIGQIEHIFGAKATFLPGGLVVLT